ncbi:hypothetical protein HK101_011743 [Irineochytrium annulatum]|nr:hypothetical protein HK101_011743 [Irineochytrium annulatum]
MPNSQHTLMSALSVDGVQQEGFLKSTTADPEAGALGKLEGGSSKGEGTDGASGELPIEDEEFVPPKMSNLTFFLVFVGLALAVFLASLDQTIVAAIATEFDGLNQISWVATAYFLTATAFIPSYGQLADIFGRKPVFLGSIIIFEIGSALCGAAKNMNMLIAARAVAGMGGGGIFSLVIIIISDMTSLRDRGKYQGLIGACYGLASVAGPLLGGAFVDHVSWRWVFYINLPLGAFTIIATVFLLNIETKTNHNYMEAVYKIDWIGTFLLIATVICLLIPIQGGGSLYAWNSPIVISLFILGALFFVAFIYVEGWVAREPVIPFALFKNRYVLGTFASALFVGMAFFVLVFYAPLWYQVVFGSTATEAGVHTFPLIMGVVFFSIFSGGFASATGIYYPFLPFGAVLVCLGAGLLSTLNESTPTWAQVIFFLISGLGVGGMIQTVLLSAQASVSPKLLAVVTANTTFMQTIGAVIGLAIVSSVFNNKLAMNLAENLRGVTLSLPAGVTSDIFLASPIYIRQYLPDDQQAPVIHAYVQTLSLVFLLAVPFGAMGLFSSFLVKKERLPLGKREVPMAA